MGDPLGRWSSSSSRSFCPSRSDHDDRSSFRPPNTFARPSGKSIYQQRKDYGQTLLRAQQEFQHHVEHLLSLRLERDLRSPEDCLGRLKALEAQGRIWGQDVTLQVKDQELVLSDVESKEELESFPLGSVQGCTAGLDNTVLAVSVQEWSPPGTTVLLFQCERPGAEVLRTSLEKVLQQRREEQRGHHGYRSSPDVPPSATPPYGAPEPPEPASRCPPPRGPPPQRGPPPPSYSAPDPPPVPRANPPAQLTAEVDRDVEVLNHVLRDLELFVAQLKAAPGSLSHKKKKKKKQKNPELPPKEDFEHFFQKVKYALNLLGRTHRHVQDPDPAELLRLIFSALTFVLSRCPSPGLAPAVETPLLLPEALELLEQSLGDDDYGTWKSLGTAWNRARVEYPNGAQVPGYVPVFSDGWLPPPREQERPGGLQDPPPPASGASARPAPRPCPRPPAQDPPPSPLGPAQGLFRALYDFQARNSQELSVRKGDTLQVLSQQKKWWLVQDERGDRGHVPGNILEPLPEPGRGGGAQRRPPALRPDSTPAEVTAWLADKGFSRITVRSLGVLRGQELLQMSPEELRAVCPEEWRRVLFKLSAARTSLEV
ncbi:LOW QUALITY PROTEIN: epidermal growth factor receptor kinase substrate 8-like protein 3 [Manacus candei]|uniref:LOW QUALITY PROTEIN: epidermal growth factor receptor kinase substrate 8-like protein 3 n=1 Tax=Manacus candei TaxID=415023 RepID=UPI002227D92D|nr:LOW QUALITY PROTEIN: epidermal growth factor receptor kinase substrate 8-like protein 3 [Manacus candei]